ncbi:hypothetical protein CBER1_09818 [Cercospora berteroae]|uniref:DUF7580 domain-containing protein n=1 Tax=Cercospora berteroae TaxID=357750 RepID=A0A2S6BX74_9PEZI|nr:hypothetical protein CBER1_09818 [Cercospora berteroae]
MVENIELPRADPTTSCDVRAYDRPATPPHTPSRSLRPVDAVIAAGTVSTQELCAVLKTNITSSDGLITLQGDQKWRHRVGLNNRFGLSSSAAIVSLREALIQGLDRKVRLALAVKLASAVLQVQTTSWMSQTWSSAEIYLLQSGRSQTRAGHAFVSVAFSEQGSKKASKAPIRPGAFPIETRNASIFALGITLIELWYGKTLASLRPKSDGTAMSTGEILVAAKSVSNEIHRDAGDCYGDAVRRCIHCDFDPRYTGLEHPEMIDAVMTSTKLLETCEHYPFSIPSPDESQ